LKKSVKRLPTNHLLLQFGGSDVISEYSGHLNSIIIATLKE